MTKDELLEVLLVERHLPLPLRNPIPVDDPRDQEARCAVLLAAVDAFEKDPGRKQPAEAPARLVKKGLLYVAERNAA